MLFRSFCLAARQNARHQRNDALRRAARRIVARVVLHQVKGADQPRLHDRTETGLGLGQGGARRPQQPGNLLADTAKAYVGTDEKGKIAEPSAREKVISFAMNQRSFQITQRRAREENTSGKTMGEATSIFKLYGATLGRDSQDLRCALMGTQGWGWEGESFTEQELESTRSMLSSRAVTIYGGTNEIQRNIISKRVLGLPD